MSRLFLLHFSPLELYPPIQNLLRLLDTKENASYFMVITTAPTINLNLFSANQIKIKRTGKAFGKPGRWLRFLHYGYFYLSGIVLLAYYRPDRVVYFETLSSFPVYIYKRYIKRAARIFIHYHEYTSPGEYQTGMKLARLFHRLEKRLYPEAGWISQTNDYRIEQFKKDLGPISIANVFTLPNFPPRHWRVAMKSAPSAPLKIIYAGALSLTTMHTREFASWVLSQAGKVIWDIYSFNFTPEAEDYITTLDSPWIKLKAGVDYDRLPEILRTYHVGVILYNGHIPNYVYNSPNKLFEYLACGLDVWFPKEMIGCYPYVTENSYPKVVSIDYQSLNEMNLPSLISHESLVHRESNFYCEPVYEEFYSAVVED